MAKCYVTVTAKRI